VRDREREGLVTMTMDEDEVRELIEFLERFAAHGPEGRILC
jgi:hypothetical protein